MDSKTELDFESLDYEVKELLKNYKFKKATVYEPCTNTNVKECLIGLTEQFEVLNISYTFNPYCDITEDQTLHLEALVKLINAIWSVLQYHRNTAEKAEKLAEENHVLGHLNKHLNDAVSRLKEEVDAKKQDAKSCRVAACRISDRSDEIIRSLAETKAKLALANKQKEALEKSLHNEISRLKLENEKLSDRLRGKSGGFKPCSEVCDATVLNMKARDKKQQAMIAKLQANIQQLLKEVLDLKEKVILCGIE